MVTNILPADPNPPSIPPYLRIGSKGQNSTFSEHGYVTYHIKWNHKLNIMLANLFPTVPSSDPWWGQKVKSSKFTLFRTWSFLPATLPLEVKRSTFNFFRTWSCCLSIKMESRMQQHFSKYFAHRITSPADPGVYRSKLSFFRTWSCCISH